MRQVQPDVWETATETPFPGLTTHAYLLRREEGNVLFYNTGNQEEIDRLAELGGLAWQFLSHRDELGPSLCRTREKYGNKLCVHAEEAADCAKHCEPDVLFQGRQTLAGNVDVISTPGHSPGSACFLVRSPAGKRYLFTGDTLYANEDGGWRAGFIPGYSREEDIPVLAQSLRLLQTLKPDVVFSSAFAGDSGFREMGPGEWERQVELALRRLESPARK